MNELASIEQTVRENKRKEEKENLIREDGVKN